MRERERVGEREAEVLARTTRRSRSRSGELRTTWDSLTGIDSFSSILRCCRYVDVGGDLDGAAVDVEEPEAVAAAGGAERAGLA